MYRSYDKTFKDNIFNDYRGNNVFGVQDNGDVFITHYGTQCEKDYYLGNYQDLGKLPKDEYVWDMPTIEEVGKFHEWLKDKVSKLNRAIAIEESLIQELQENELGMENIQQIIRKYLI